VGGVHAHLYGNEVEGSCRARRRRECSGLAALRLPSGRQAGLIGQGR